ncbi:MAG: L-glutamate gamma-semialdehyde dehydrogenase [Flammeovirgaceae bacterium]|nr:L-glutamate gamma-semialdehyde dehydrogenase [Flammeovirgaceae bacterium]|tara:strand:- start:9081 stop:10712 length:1632 start_codon:yes stop_codon:yes gene_type:complete
MPQGNFKIPAPKNEPVLNYAPGSSEKYAVKEALKIARSQEIDVPMYIGSKEVRTGRRIKMTAPHDHQFILGYFHEGDASHVEEAIDAALAAKNDWANLGWEQRAAIFLKAADLLAGPFRAKINAATMLGQSKNIYQAEIDAACEYIDFLRFNAAYMEEIYSQQPSSAPGIWNRIEYRSLEGFVFAVTPFNFTSIAGNLCTAPALMGNTIVWKPAYTQIYSAQVLMQVFKEAGLPAGVINLIYVDGPVAGEIIFKHPDFAGLHFTGSTGVFKQLWKSIGQNIDRYKSYPRIVGETGGKDFIVAHHTASAPEVATAILRGAFEYQGQKCSAASRVYLPDNLWPSIKKKLLRDLDSMKMGSPEDFTNFVNAVIDQRSFAKITAYIDRAAASTDAEIIAGGNYDGSSGYFVAPTVILTRNPKYATMCEEIFGPVVTIYVYPQDDFEATLLMVDQTSPYALTGAIFSKDRYAIDRASELLKHAAGNFYINDKPTGAVVGQQPFGGARGSGTNDKAGAQMNLLRWVSARTIKETFIPATEYGYPFLEEE